MAPRVSWYREARVKSYPVQSVRHLVGARDQLMGVAVDLSNQIRSTLKKFDLMAGKGVRRAFESRVYDLIANRSTAANIVELPLAAWRAVRGQIRSWIGVLWPWPKGMPPAACR